MAWEKHPSTPQTEAPSYRLAFQDMDFLCRDDLRPVRLQLELLKPELIQKEQGVRSTVVVFGGTRVVENAWARRRCPRWRWCWSACCRWCG